MDGAAGPIPEGGSRVIRLAGRALPYDRTYHLLSRFDRLSSLVRALEPDVVEAHSPYLGAAGAVASGRGVARVLTAFWHADHIGAYAKPAVARVLGRRASEAAERILWGAVPRLLAPFDATFVAGHRQAHMLRTAGVSPVFHVPFGVDVSTFHPRARSEARRAALLGAGSASAAVLVGVGRLSAEKRWDVVLDAFARVRARRDAVLVLFGDGPERARLQDRAPSGVRFAGFVRDREELAGALASADALVHGCACETSGLGVFEATACGLPVVVPEDGGAIEGADPACSASYRSFDAAACAAAIERILDRDPRSLRERALGAAGRLPSAADHAAAVARVYADLLRA